MRRRSPPPWPPGPGSSGCNNRNLRDFSVNLDNAARLRDRVPPGVLYVAGKRRTHARRTWRRCEAMGADGVLIGEALMRAKDKSAMLDAV